MRAARAVRCAGSIVCTHERGIQSLLIPSSARYPWDRSAKQRSGCGVSTEGGKQTATDPSSEQSCWLENLHMEPSPLVLQSWNGTLHDRWWMLARLIREWFEVSHGSQVRWCWLAVDALGKKEASTQQLLVTKGFVCYPPLQEGRKSRLA